MVHGDNGSVWKQFWLSQQGGVVLEARMLLNALQSLSSAPTIRNYSGQMSIVLRLRNPGPNQSLSSRILVQSMA